MSGSKTSSEDGEPPSLNLILERLQDALFEECTVNMPSFDYLSDDEDATQTTQWNVTTKEGRAFRGQIEEFENKYLDVFDIDDDDEYTFEMSKIHKEFQNIVENEICLVLEGEFSMTPREFYTQLLKLRSCEDIKLINAKNKESSTEIMQIFFSVLSFEDFARDMRRKAKSHKLLVENNRSKK
eukprot:g2629.t1